MDSMDGLAGWLEDPSPMNDGFQFYNVIKTMDMCAVQLIGMRSETKYVIAFYLFIFHEFYFEAVAHRPIGTGDLLVPWNGVVKWVTVRCALPWPMPMNAYICIDHKLNMWNLSKLTVQTGCVMQRRQLYSFCAKPNGIEWNVSFKSGSFGSVKGRWCLRCLSGILEMIPFKCKTKEDELLLFEDNNQTYSLSVIS